MRNYKIAVIVGSLRKESFNLKTAKAMVDLAPESLSFDFLEIGDLPLFDQDLEGNPPKEWVRFREQIRAADGVLFFTPEYNRSVPGVLKNAIDVGSRPYGENSWDGKPGAVVSVSIGNISGFGANHHLRQSLVFINVPTMAQPEAYVANAGELFDDNGNLTKGETEEFFRNYIMAFENWVKKFAGE